MPIASSVAEVADLLDVPRERAHARSGGRASTSPAVQSVWCMLTHVDARPRRVARRGAPAAVERSAPVEWTRCTSGPRAPSVDQERRPPRAQPQAVGGAGRRPPPRARARRRRGRRGRARARSRCPARRRGRRGGARRARPARPPSSAPPALRRQPCRATASWTSTTSPSALRRASDSRPRAPQLERPAERRQRVLGLVGAGAPVGEGDRAVTAAEFVYPRRRPAPGHRTLKCSRPGVPMPAGKWATSDLGGGPVMTTVRAQCPAAATCSSRSTT